jgi:hypothetical protein
MDETDQLRAFYAEVLSFQSKSFDQSSSYNQVVVLAGYAAFFAVWSAVSDKVSEWVVLTCGGLIILSVMVYVAWTVANMIFLSTYQHEMSAKLSEGFEGFYERMLEVDAKFLGTRARLMKFWLPVVATAGGTGLAAAVLLAAAAIGQTLHYSLGCE